MRWFLLGLAAVAVLSLAPPASADDIARDARIITDNKAFKRQMTDPFAYGSGVRGCKHVDRRKVRCRGYVLTFRNNDVPMECDFLVTVWPISHDLLRGRTSELPCFEIP